MSVSRKKTFAQLKPLSADNGIGKESVSCKARFLQIFKILLTAAFYKGCLSLSLLVRRENSFCKVSSMPRLSKMVSCRYKQIIFAILILIL